jgi:hypothetical protein
MLHTAFKKNYTTGTFIAVSVTLLSMQACNQIKHEAFITKIMSDFSSNSSFVVLNVKLPGGMSTSIIENDDLFYYFYKAKGYDESKYQSEIGSIIKQEKYLDMTNADFLTFGFTKVIVPRKIIADARKGKDMVLNKYFKNHVIKDEVTDDEKGALIRLLFDWSIPTSIDTKSGYLVINTKQ